MNNRGLKMEVGGGAARSATPLSDASCPAEEHRRRCALPAQSKTWRRFVVSLVFLAAALTAHAQYSIGWSKIAGGGGTSTGGVYSVSGTIGQHDAGGPMTNGSYSLVGGFWALPVLVQTPGAPTLHITNAAPGFVTIWWTPPTPGFTLQSTDSLSPTNWGNTASDTNNPATVQATLPTRFHRLFKP